MKRILDITWNVLGVVFMLGFYGVVFIYPFTLALTYLVPSDDVAIEIVISGERFQIGDTSTIIVTLQNQTSKVRDSKIVTTFPQNFLSGFIVDYPDACALNQGIMGLGQNISCTVSLSPHKPSSVSITIAPYQEGNYGGNIEVQVTFWKGILGSLSKKSVPVNISVIPK